MVAIERSAAERADFKQELTDVVPHLRAFARGLCGRADMADDLVQETMLKAWAARERFEPGTSMRAWTFVILRNVYLTDMRRNRFRGDYDEAVAERILTAPPDQEEPIHLSDMHRALLTLPPERREALLLVGAGGFSYEEAANICDCAVGTIKSRVGRARATLNSMLADDDVPQRSTNDATAHRAILEEFGVPSQQIFSVVGRGDAEPYFPDDPYLASNQRVSILLVDEEPPLPVELTP